MVENSNTADIAAMLVAMEDRLCKCIGRLSAQLQDFETAAIASPHEPRKACVSVSAAKSKQSNWRRHATNASGSQSQTVKSSPLSKSPSVVLPQSLEESSAGSPKPVWKQFGAKPSQAAKEMVQSALTKTQKKSIMRSLKDGDSGGNLDGNKTSIPGIDLMLDYKEEQVGRFTESLSCWWAPHSDAHLLESAIKKADQLKTSVHDLLLSKGWVTNKYQGISSRNQSKHKLVLSGAERIVESTRFEMACAVMIISNAFFLGYQTQYNANSENDGNILPGQREIQVGFTIWFVAELFLRLYAWRLGFFISPDWKWNVFDLVVVTTSVVEFCFQEGGDNAEKNSSTNFAGVRVIRILRLVRVVRFIRVVRFFSELRMMIYSSLKSVKPFFWALCILLMIIYMFAIVCCQNVSEYRREHPEENLKTMMDFFGSMYETIYTLFMIISGGVSWIEPANELRVIHWSFTIWMSLYVSFVVFAVLNIVTGIFIESAFRSAQDDQDVVIQDEMNQEDSLAQAFLEVYDQCDYDKSGYITLDGFEAHMADHRVRAFLHHLGLDVTEARGLFNLLDIGGTGRVYAKEFVMGCQQLKGPAKNLDVATLLFQNKRMMALWAVFMSFVEDQFSILTNTHKEEESPSPTHHTASLASASVIITREGVVDTTVMI